MEVEQPQQQSHSQPQSRLTLFKEFHIETKNKKHLNIFSDASFIEKTMTGTTIFTSGCLKKYTKFSYAYLFPILFEISPNNFQTTVLLTYAKSVKKHAYINPIKAIFKKVLVEIGLSPLYAIENLTHINLFDLDDDLDER